MKKRLQWWKFLIAVVFDTIDFSLGRIPILGTVVDIVGTALSLWLWGPIGLIAGWEIGDFTDQVDGFVPSVTILGIVKFIEDKVK
jgi:hypothetical protein